MLCKILKTFSYSEDGVNLKRAEKNTEVDIPDESVEGLFEEGFVGPPDTAEDPDSQEEPVSTPPAAPAANTPPPAPAAPPAPPVPSED